MVEFDVSRRHIPARFDELIVYEHLCNLRQTTCSASRGSTFASALGFVKDILGTQSPQACIDPARVTGAAYLGKRPLGQAPALTRVMVCILQLAAFRERERERERERQRETYLRALAGFCVACIYGRMRVSGLHRSVDVPVMDDY